MANRSLLSGITPLRVGMIRIMMPALLDIIVGIINDKEDHPNVHLELT